MVSTVRQRPNHYEVLGIAPGASADEIARAFAKELHKPGPFGVLAHVGLAFETLRDPVRRRDYDRSIGLPERVERPVIARSLSGTVTIGRPAAVPVAEPEARPAPFVAAPRREPVARAPAPARTPPPPPRPRPAPIEPLFDSAESGTIDWKRAGTVGGALVAAVALMGAWAGWEASNDTPQLQSQQVVRRALPPAQPQALSAAETIDEAPVAEPVRQRVAEARPVKRPRVRPVELTAEEEQELAGNAFVDSVTQAAGAQLEAPAVQAASMPLPDRLIARTIRRIGYPCGAVASKAEAGVPGVFTVTCTSGHSYRAQPVRGRYRFKRLGGA